MNKLYIYFTVALLFACNNKNDQNQQYEDSTAVTVEEAAMDTSFYDPTAVMVEEPADDLQSYDEDLDQETADEFSEYKYNHRSGTPGNYEYNYDISGEDEDGNSVTGNVDIRGKFGSGFITDEDGNEKSIDVQWIAYGILNGTDEDGISYEFHVNQ